MKRPAPRPTCNGCRSFVITHDREWPYACRAFGIRSKRHPVIDVTVSSGLECQAREERENKRPDSGAKRAG